MDGFDRLAERYGATVVEAALDDAVAAIVTADPTLAPSRVLSCLDYDEGQEALSFGGRFASEVVDRAGSEGIQEARALFNARLVGG